MKRLVAGIALLLLVPTLAWAGKKGPQYRGQGYAFVGVGTGAHDCASCGAVLNVGFGGNVFLYKGLGFGVEAGYAHWGPGPFDNQAYLASGDFSYHFRRRAVRGQVDPFVEAGATGYFPTDYGRGAAAGNFGGGANVWLTRRIALRVGVRDYVNHNSEFNGFPGTNSVSFRIGVTFR